VKHLDFNRTADERRLYFKRLAMYRTKCPIHNGTLENINELSTFFSLKIDYFYMKFLLKNFLRISEQFSKKFQFKNDHIFHIFDKSFKDTVLFRK